MEGNLQRLDFSAYMAERAEDFTGREWVFQEADAWLAGADRSHIFLLIGGPGTGKTAVAARLAQMSLNQANSDSYRCLGKDSLAYYHFCQAQSDTTLNPLRFVEALSAALANRYPPFAEALLQASHRDITVTQNVSAAENGSQVTGIAIQSLRIGNLSARFAFDWAVRRPLKQLCRSGFSQTVVILLDSLDEARTYSPDENIVTLLADATNNTQDLPRQVRFLLTSRPDPRILDLIGQPSLDLVADAPPDIDDVYAYSVRRLSALPEPVRSELAGRIAAAGEGNFLYARHVLDDLVARPDALADPAILTLPEGLDDVYRQFIRRELRRNEERWSERYRPLLGVLAVAHSPGLTQEHLSAAAGLPPSKTDDALAACVQYLTGTLPKGPFTLYHQSFREFLLKDPQYSVYPAEAEQMLGKLFLQAYGDDWASCEDGYALRHTPGHLTRAAAALTQPLQRGVRRELEDALGQVLTNLYFLQARLGALSIVGQQSPTPSVEGQAHRSPATVYDVLRDFQNALAVLPSGHPLRGRVSALFDAMNAHSRALDLDATLFVQQMYNALVWDWNESTTLGREVREAARRYQRTWLRQRSRAMDTTDPALLRTLRAHYRTVRSVSFSLDGRLLASGSKGGGLILWDVEFGQLKRWLVGHRASVDAIAFSPDGRTMASGGEDRIVRLWDTQTGQLKWTLETSARVYSVMFSPDGTILAHSGWGVQLLDAQTGQLRRTLEVAFSVSSIAFSPDRRTMAIGGGDAVELWDTQTGQRKRTLTGPSTSVTTVAFCADGTIVAAGFVNGAMMLWDAQTGKLRRSLTGDHELVYSHAFFPDGTTVASADSYVYSVETGKVKLWDVETGELRRTLVGHTGSLNALALSPDGKLLASGADDSTVRIWNATEEKGAPEHIRHATRVQATAFSPDGKTLASGNENDFAILWDVQDQRERRLLMAFQESTMAVALSPDAPDDPIMSDSRVAYGVEPQEASLISVSKAKSRPPTADDLIPAGASAVAFSPDGMRLATGGRDGLLRLWDLQSWKLLYTFAGRELSIRAVAFAPDGGMLATVARSDKVNLWDLENGRLLRTLTDHKFRPFSVAFSPDGRTLVAGGASSIFEGGVRVWAVGRGKLIQTLTGHDTFVWSVSFSADGSTVASGSLDGSVMIWDPQTWRLSQTLSGKSELMCVALSHDGKLLVSGSTDNAAELWDVQQGERFAWFPCQDRVGAVWFGPDSQRIQIADMGGGANIPTIYVLDLVDRRATDGSHDRPGTELGNGPRRAFAGDE